jgi:hypothetical protein
MENVMENTHVSELNAKHEALHQKIRIEMMRPLPDASFLATLKKQKLRLKEELARA